MIGVVILDLLTRKRFTIGEEIEIIHLAAEDDIRNFNKGSMVKVHFKSLDKYLDEGVILNCETDKEDLNRVFRLKIQKYKS